MKIFDILLIFAQNMDCGYTFIARTCLHDVCLTEFDCDANRTESLSSLCALSVLFREWVSVYVSEMQSVLS